MGDGKQAGRAMTDKDSERDGASGSVGDGEPAMPNNRREARQWIRRHWAEVIDLSDMGAVAEMGNRHLDEVWGDECEKIARRLRQGTGSAPAGRVDS